MEETMKAVIEGNNFIRMAARVYEVPRTTLQDRITEKNFHRTKPRPTPYLNKTEENELAEFLQTTKVGFGKTRKQVMNIVELTAKKKDL